MVPCVIVNSQSFTDLINFLSVFPPYRGGISKFSDYMYHHLIDESKVIAYNFSRLYPDLFFPGASQYEENTEATYATPILHSYNPVSWKRTAKQIIKNNPETLLFSYWHPFFIPAYKSVIKRVRKECPHTKISTLAHNVSPHEGFPFSKQLMKSFFQANDLIITLSEQTENELKDLNVSTKSLKLFHPVYDRAFPDTPRNELKAKYGIQDDEVIILFFGLIRSYKGLDILIRALNEMNLKEFKIRPFIVGEFYDDQNKYMQLIKDEHHDQFKVIDRFVSQKEANEIFTISDLLVLPYTTASQSGVFNDALNFELPTLVSDHPGLTEHIEHAKTGLIFPNKDVTALRDQLTTYLSEGDLRANIRSNLGALKEELSWDHFISKLTPHL